MAAWRLPEGVADSESAKNDDATHVWKVVKPSRPPKNALLMKTGGAMADMRRKMAEAACMFGPHACRKAALGVLAEMGMAVGGRKGMASRVLGGLAMVDMVSSIIGVWTGRKVRVQCHWVGMKRPK